MGGAASKPRPDAPRFQPDSTNAVRVLAPCVLRNSQEAHPNDPLCSSMLPTFSSNRQPSIEGPEQNAWFDALLPFSNRRQDVRGGPTDTGSSGDLRVRLEAPAVVAHSVGGNHNTASVKRLANDGGVGPDPCQRASTGLTMKALSTGVIRTRSRATSGRWVPQAPASVPGADCPLATSRRQTASFFS